MEERSKNEGSSESVAACHEFHASLNELRKEELLCDVTILDDEQQITHAHSVVLASGSEVLRSALTLKQSSQMIQKQGLTIRVGGLTIKVWELLLEFLYLRRLTGALTPSAIQELYRAAKLLAVKSLVNSLQAVMDKLKIDTYTPEQSAINITLAPSTHSSTIDRHTQVGDGETEDEEESLPSNKRKRLDVSQFSVIKKDESDESYYEEDSGDLSEDSGTFQSRCRHCSQMFPNVQALARHIAGQCTVLNKQSNQVIDGEEVTEENDESSVPPVRRRRTIQGAHRMKEQMLMCLNPECGEDFVAYSDLMEHHKRCLLADTSYNIEDYITTAADGTVTYNDHFYDKSIVNAVETPTASLLNSMSSSGRNRKAQYRCNECDATCFLDRMKTHLAITHGKRKPYHCKKCGSRYGYWEGMRDHYAASHSEGVHLTCPQCAQQFTKKEALRRHVLMEHKREGKAVHACGGCGKRFKYASHARRHETYHQPVEQRRRFECEVCHKAFLSRQDLFRHHQTHTGKKSYQCSRCNFRSVRRFNLVLHERKHGVVHGNYVCINCGRYFMSEARFQNHLRMTKHEGTHVSFLPESSQQSEDGQPEEGEFQVVTEDAGTDLSQQIEENKLTLQEGDISGLEGETVEVLFEGSSEAVRVSSTQLKQLLAQADDQSVVVM